MKDIDYFRSDENLSEMFFFLLYRDSFVICVKCEPDLEMCFVLAFPQLCQSYFFFFYFQKNSVKNSLESKIEVKSRVMAASPPAICVLQQFFFSFY